jgi:hypothetical protein
LDSQGIVKAALQASSQTEHRAHNNWRYRIKQAKNIVMMMNDEEEKMVELLTS